MVGKMVDCERRLWLRRYGFEPVLVERAPTLRTGGYLVDFWGLGFEVADRMGLLPALS
jgi:2-polyprenyl-6-methoxyphenol hydroxylase-like FAD-dependent oxidoreductase